MTSEPAKPHSVPPRQYKLGQETLDLFGQSQYLNLLLKYEQWVENMRLVGSLI